MWWRWRVRSDDSSSRARAQDLGGRAPHGGSPRFARHRTPRPLVALGMTMLLLALACTKSQPVSPAPTASQPPPAAASAPTIVFPDNYAVRVEIAADDDTRQQGLMYRDRLPEASGMIFIFPQPGDFPFWMKN